MSKYFSRYITKYFDQVIRSKNFDFNKIQITNTKKLLWSGDHEQKFGFFQNTSSKYLHKKYCDQMIISKNFDFSKKQIPNIYKNTVIRWSWARRTARSGPARSQTQSSTAGRPTSTSPFSAPNPGGMWQVCDYLFISLSLYISIYIYIFVSIYLSIIYLCICLSPSNCLSLPILSYPSRYPLCILVCRLCMPWLWG